MGSLKILWHSYQSKVDLELPDRFSKNWKSTLFSFHFYQLQLSFYFFFMVDGYSNLQQPGSYPVCDQTILLTLDPVRHGVKNIFFTALRWMYNNDYWNYKFIFLWSKIPESEIWTNVQMLKYRKRKIYIGVELPRIFRHEK